MCPTHSISKSSQAFKRTDPYSPGRSCSCLPPAGFATTGGVVPGPAVLFRAYSPGRSCLGLPPAGFATTGGVVPGLQPWPELLGLATAIVAETCIHR